VLEPLPCLPSKWIRPADHVVCASLSSEAPSFASRPGRSRGAKAAGLRFEAKAKAQLQEDFGDQWIPGPWFRYYNGGVDGNLQERWCQPDGLVIDADRGLLTIVEIKLGHVADAWWQLYRLYLPVVQEVFGEDWTYHCCEYVRYFDVVVAFPVEVTIAATVTDRAPGGFNVVIKSEL